MQGFSAWAAVSRAVEHDRAARLAFRVLHRGELITVGSVARKHLGDLQRWPTVLNVDEHGADLIVDHGLRTRLLGEINLSLHEDGLITGWRQEPFALVGPALQMLAVVERAAARFWGLLTFGAHCNGYVVGPGKRPTHLWIARRAAGKTTDPGKLDNMVGGGVTHGQPLKRTLVREAWEEAGLSAALASRAVEGRLLGICRDVPEGLQNEWIQAYDLEMPESVVPSNQDGEVAAFAKLPIDEALALAATDEMTVDAALVTLDFAMRRGLFDAAVHATCERLCAGLWRQRPTARPGLGVRWR